MIDRQAVAAEVIALLECDPAEAGVVREQAERLRLDAFGRSLRDNLIRVVMNLRERAGLAEANLRAASAVADGTCARCLADVPFAVDASPIGEGPPEPADDYEVTFNEFWRELVCNPDGTLNPDAVKRELHDYRTVLSEVPKVYDHVTGGRLSKPNTEAVYVIEAADRNYAEMYADG